MTECNMTNKEITIDLLNRLKTLRSVKMPMREIIAACEALKEILSGFPKPDNLEPFAYYADAELT